MASGSIWVDITELFGQFKTARHLTGISRTILQLVDKLVANPGTMFHAARPLFWHPMLRRALTTEDSRLLPLSAFFPRLQSLYTTAGLRNATNRSRATKAIVSSLPRPLRYRLFPADNGVVLFARWAQQQGIRLVPARFADGDCLFVPGSFWLGNYMLRLVAQARTARIPVTAFVHDVLLLSHPEWLPGRHSDQFRRGCEAFLPYCAAIVCNSRSTQEELRRLVSLPDDIILQTCRLADELSEVASTSVPATISEMLDRQYVLFVSTIVPRKNHRLLIEAWHYLWEEFGTSTPYLLCVGGGRPDARLATMLEQQGNEGGRIVWLGGIDDRSLEALYRGAWLTTYPSLGEGYGLPVAEALSRGKVCLAAPSGGIREISTDLIDFIDPLDPQSVVIKIKSYFSDPASLAAREAEIRRRYRSTSWTVTAQAIRSVLEQSSTCHFALGSKTDQLATIGAPR